MLRLDLLACLVNSRLLLGELSNSLVEEIRLPSSNEAAPLSTEEVFVDASDYGLRLVLAIQLHMDAVCDVMRAVISYRTF